MDSWAESVVSTLLAVVLLASPVAAGQAATELRGSIVDDTGAVLIGALVRLDDGLGKVTQTETDGTGRFLFEHLPPGAFMLSAEAEGFQPLSLGVDVIPPMEPLQLSLRVLLEETVDINDVPASLSAEPNRNLSSFILTGGDLANLPRNQMLLMRRLAEMAGFTGRPEALSVYIDGFALRRRLPPLETIQMIRVGANSFDARYAEPGQQRIEIVTKPSPVVPVSSWRSSTGRAGKSFERPSYCAR